MAIELKEREDIYLNNKKFNFWNILKSLYFLLSFISTIILIIIIIILIILLKTYYVGCDGIKDGVIVCNITEMKNLENDPNYMVKFVEKYCPYLWK